MNKGRQITAGKEIGCGKHDHESNVARLRNGSVLAKVQPRVPGCGGSRVTCFTLCGLKEQRNCTEICFKVQMKDQSRVRATSCFLLMCFYPPTLVMLIP